MLSITQRNGMATCLKKATKRYLQCAYMPEPRRGIPMTTQYTSPEVNACIFLWKHYNFRLV